MMNNWRRGYRYVEIFIEEKRIERMQTMNKENDDEEKDKDDKDNSEEEERIREYNPKISYKNGIIDGIKRYS